MSIILALKSKLRFFEMKRQSAECRTILNKSLFSILSFYGFVSVNRSQCVFFLPSFLFNLVLTHFIENSLVVCVVFFVYSYINFADAYAFRFIHFNSDRKKTDEK